jgi:hypothetical protein
METPGRRQASLTKKCMREKSHRRRLSPARSSIRRSRSLVHALDPSVRPHRQNLVTQGSDAPALVVHSLALSVQNSSPSSSSDSIMASSDSLRSSPSFSSESNMASTSELEESPGETDATNSLLRRPFRAASTSTPARADTPASLTEALLMSPLAGVFRPSGGEDLAPASSSSRSAATRSEAISASGFSKAP